MGKKPSSKLKCKDKSGTDMPTVDINRLKGNFGAAVVMEHLSSKCLVRQVIADTDVGIDLYCESIEESEPFLHFWVQVRSGDQCKVSRDGASASCKFKLKHLNYWSKQPVPVFAALVPISTWPPQQPEKIYIVDITKQIVFYGIPLDKKSKVLHSNYSWDNDNSLDDFLSKAVPDATVLLSCKKGVVAPHPTRQIEYTQIRPLVPVDKYKTQILNQLRTTAAFSLISLEHYGKLTEETSDFVKKLAGIVLHFKDDVPAHWENFMALGLAFHSQAQYVDAVEMYGKAIDIIVRNYDHFGLEVIRLTTKVEKLVQKAQNKKKP